MGYIDRQCNGTPAPLSSGQQTTDPGNYVDLINVTNPSNLRKIISAKVFCRAETKVELLQNNVLIGSGRTGPGDPNFSFNYDPAQPLVPGANLVLKVLACVGTAPTDVEGYILAEDF